METTVLLIVLAVLLAGLGVRITSSQRKATENQREIIVILRQIRDALTKPR